jgi:NADH-quinone oxidoreductase subunit G
MDRLKAAERPMLIVGMGALARPDGAQVLHAARALAEAAGMVREDWNGFNVLHTAAARVAGLDLGLLPAEDGHDAAGILDGTASGEINLIWLLGADEIDTARLGRAFVVYQGHHGDTGAHRADVILPGAAYTEKDGTWVNTEGRVQRSRRAVFPPGDAREDWAILRAFSETVGHKLPYDNLAQVRARMVELVPALATLDRAAPGEWGAFGALGEMAPAPFRSPVEDFFLTNPICRASTVMAELSQLASARKAAEATGTDG